MQILFFSDLHGDMDALKELKKMGAEADIIVAAGDISVMEQDIKQILSGINEFNKPVLMIHGNHEDERGLMELCDKYDNITFLHKGFHRVGEYLFLGYGGDGFSTNDPDFTLVANKFFKQNIQPNDTIIFVTHGPAYDTGIDRIYDDPRGNKSYREFIDEVKPHLAISGHLHENAGKNSRIGRTLFINPGKEGAIVNI
jgi:Icc-related predicted phosphoesterase